MEEALHAALYCVCQAQIFNHSSASPLPLGILIFSDPWTMEYCTTKFCEKFHVYMYAYVLDYKYFLFKRSLLTSCVSVFITCLYSYPITIYHLYGTHLLAI